MSTDGKKKLGRPASDEKRDEMERITFRVDPETKAALDSLVAKEPGDIRGRQSIVLRRLILAAIGKLSD